MNRRVVFAPDEYYHLYNRGVDKRTVFNTKYDYLRFCILLYVCNSTSNIQIINFGRTRRSLNEFFNVPKGEPLVDLVAFCFMPNHYHLLVREISSNGISKFMQKLATGYTMYFNTKYDRSGALFQGKFKATHIDSDTYLKYITSYIHLNPVKLIDPTWKERGLKSVTQAEKFLNTYAFSSFLDYRGVLRDENYLLNRDAYPAYFNSVSELDSEMRAWLSYKSAE